MFESWWFPEIALIESAANRRKVYGRALRKSLRRHWSGAVATAMIPLLGLLTGAIVYFGLTFGQRFGLRESRVNLILAIAIPVSAGFFLYVWGAIVHPLLFRQHLRKALWREMSLLGYPICPGCGYDVRESRSGVCPGVRSQVRVAANRRRKAGRIEQEWFCREDASRLKNHTTRPLRQTQPLE